MPTPVREAALAEIFARLVAQLAGVVVERARLDDVDLKSATLPLAVLVGGDQIDSDDRQEPGQTHYRLPFAVVAYARGADGLAVEQALNDLHARMVAALVPWVPATIGLGEVAERGADVALYSSSESAKPAGSVAARFEILAIAPTGSPYL